MANTVLFGRLRSTKLRQWRTKPRNHHPGSEHNFNKARQEIALAEILANGDRALTQRELSELSGLDPNLI